MKARHGKALHVYIGILRRSRPLFLPTLFLPMRSRSGRPDGGGGGPDGAPSSPSSGRRGGPDAGMEAPAAAADPTQGVEPSFFSLRSMVDLVPLTLAPLQIPDDGGEQRRRVLLRARWRAAAWPVRRGSTARRRQPAATARIHGGAAPTRRDGTDPRRGVVSLPPNRRRRRSGGRGAHPGPSSPSGGAAGWSCGGSNLRRWIDGGGGI